MNYLAHLYLSDENENILVGNFLADRLNLKDTQSLNKLYLPGISFHRHIDKTTDNHPYFKSKLKLMYPTYGKYASVILDIMMDYLLATNWISYSEESYTDFKSRIYATLSKHLTMMPLKSQPSIKSMIDHNWLDAYTTWEGLTDVLNRLDKRTSFKSQFVETISFLKDNESKFQAGFPQFIDDLKLSNSRYLHEYGSNE